MLEESRVYACTSISDGPHVNWHDSSIPLAFALDAAYRDAFNELVISICGIVAGWCKSDTSTSGSANGQLLPGKSYTTCTND